MTTLNDIPLLEDLLFCLGHEGCLFLCYLQTIERLTHTHFDVVRTAWDCIDHGLLGYYKPDPTADLGIAMFVYDGDRLCSHITGKKCKVTVYKEPPASNVRVDFVRYSLQNKTHFEQIGIPLLNHSKCRSQGKITRWYHVDIE